MTEKEYNDISYEIVDMVDEYEASYLTSLDICDIYQIISKKYKTHERLNESDLLGINTILNMIWDREEQRDKTLQPIIEKKYGEIGLRIYDEVVGR